jgi:hypothetical protein
LRTATGNIILIPYLHPTPEMISKAPNLLQALRGCAIKIHFKLPLKKEAETVEIKLRKRISLSQNTYIRLQIASQTHISQSSTSN